MSKPTIEVQSGPAPQDLLIEDITVGEGIPGMRVGGRRKLIIPPDMAYGPAGTGHPLGGRTLVFVIDLVDVK